MKEPIFNFEWQPPLETGKIVGMIQYQDMIIIATEYAVYRAIYRDSSLHFERVPFVS